MNKELYLNETTKVGVVVQNENELKIVKSNENEDTFRILSLQNEIERENEHVKMLKETLSDLKWNNFFKVCMYVISIIPFYMVIYILFDMINTCGWSLPDCIILILAGGTGVASCLCGALIGGKFKQNNARIKELPNEIKDSNEKIVELEKELEKLKRDSKYNENEITDEYVRPLNIINYPERTNEDTIGNDIQSSPKINKIIFSHTGTTK